MPFFAYLGEIRKVIYTTNAVESVNMSLRKIIKTRGSFRNEEALNRFQRVSTSGCRLENSETRGSQKVS